MYFFFPALLQNSSFTSLLLQQRKIANALPSIVPPTCTLVSVVVIISIAIAVVLATHLVQHNAQNVSARIHKLVLHVARHFDLNLTTVEHENHAIDKVAQHQGICNRQYRRRVEQHVVIFLCCSRENMLHSLAAK